MIFFYFHKNNYYIYRRMTMKKNIKFTIIGTVFAITTVVPSAISICLLSTNKNKKSIDSNSKQMINKKI